MLIFVLTVLCLCANALSELTCTDWQGRAIPDGEDFYPYKDDPCHMCRCYQGESTMCKAVSCSPPKCPKWREISKKCCHYECLDIDGSSYTPDNNTENRGTSFNGDGTPTEAGTVTDLGLRLVASTITTFLILALLLFLIHRFRQRRLLMTLRRYGRRREHLDDSDNISYTPDFFGVQCPPYEDPPPPYTPPKPQPGEQPPPYETLEPDNPSSTGDSERYTDNNSANSSHGNLLARGAHSSNSSGECLIRRQSNSNSDGSHMVTRGVNTGLSDSNVCDDRIDCSAISCGNQQVSRAIQAVGKSSSRVRHSGRVAQDSHSNRASVHFKNSPTGQPTITMGIQDRQFRNRNSGISLSNQSSPIRNSIGDRTNALNLELRSAVQNIRNRSWCEAQQGCMVTQADHSSSTTDIGESTTSAESLTSSPESPECAAEFHISSSPEALSHDADSTVKRFLDQFGPVSRGRRYPTTMSQSWTSSQIPQNVKHVKPSISIGAFPQESDSSCQLPQHGGCHHTGIRPLLPRSKSEHLKTNGSLINHPFNGVVKSTGSAKPSSFQPHGNGVRVAYKEPDELSPSHSQFSTAKQNSSNRSSLSFTKNLSCQDNYIRSDVIECGSLGSNVSNLAAAILDPGDIIVTKRQDELRKLRLSHLLSNPLFCPGSSSGNQAPDCFSPDTRQLYRSFSENSVDVSSVSASSETFEKGVLGSVLGNDSKYPSNSYKNLLQTCLSGRPQRQVVDRNECCTPENNSDNPVISTTGRRKDNKPMVNSWHAGMCESDDENMSVSTLARNSNQHFEKKLCHDKDVANIFLPLKPSNAEKSDSVDNPGVPNSEMRACASQMYAYETGDFPREKNHRSKHLLKQYSSGCVTTRHREISANTCRKSAKKSKIESDQSCLGSSVSNQSNRRLSCPDPKVLQHNSGDGFSAVKDSNRPYLMHSAIPTDVALLEHSIPALLQLRNTEGRPRNDKRRSKSVGRCEATRASSRKSAGSSASRGHTRKKNLPQQTCSFHRELENVLENKKSVTKQTASKHRQSYSEFNTTNCAISQV